MLPLVLVGIATACSGTKAHAPASTSSTVEPVTKSPSGPVVIRPGEFRYQNFGLVVTLELKTNTGTMVVSNGSGHPLGKPGIYVIDGTTGRQIDGKVLAGKPLASGAKATFQVQFPPVVNDKEIGLVILLFGTDNYGALAPA